MERSSIIFTLVLSVLYCAGDLRAATPDPKLAANPNQVRGDEITPAQQDAVKRGLRWLADHQSRDGSFGAGGGSGRNTAVTALAGLAFMQAGNLPGRGQYADNVTKCLEFTLNSCQES